MNTHKPPLKRIDTAFPFLLLVVAITGFILAYEFYGLIFALKSLSYVIPIILAATIFLIRRKDKDSGFGIFRAIKYIKQISFLNLVLITVLFYIISIIVLVYFPTRHLPYFGIVALISGSIFLQIFTHRGKGTDYLIIIEVVMLSLNLIWGVVLKYPLYFGATDILSHLYNINTILQTGNISSMGVDLHFPLFHIYNAIGVEVTALSVRTGLFLFMGLVWEAGILFTYLLFMKITNSRRFSLVACLIYALTSVVTQGGMYAITRSLAFVLILGWVYLVININNYRYVFLSLVVMAALILTHHTTIFLAIPILIVVYIFQRIFQRNKPARPMLTLLPIMGLTIFFFGYLVFIATDFTSTIFVDQLLGVFHPELGIDISILHQQQYYYVLGNIGGSIILFLALIGIGIALRQYAYSNKRFSFIFIGIPSLLFLLFYFDNITQLIPSSGVLLLWRIPILVSFFVIFMGAYGLNYLIQLGKNTISTKIWLPALSTVVILVMSFFFQISPSVANDVDYVQKSADVGDTYFTSSELKAFTFVIEKCNFDSTLYGDYETLKNRYSLNIDAFTDTRLITGDLRNFQEGYLIFRSGELQKSGGLNISLDGSWDYIYRYHLKDSTTNILNNLSNEERIYSNNDAQLFIRLE